MVVIRLQLRAGQDTVRVFLGGKSVVEGDVQTDWDPSPEPGANVSPPTAGVEIATEYDDKDPDHDQSDDHHDNDMVLMQEMDLALTGKTDGGGGGCDVPHQLSP